MAPNGDLWVNQYFNGSIAVLAPGGALVRSIDLAANPTRVTFNGPYAYFADEYGGKVFAVARTSGNLAYTIAVPSPVLAGVAIGPDGIGYILAGPRSIETFNAATGAPISEIVTDPKPRGLAFSADGSLLATVSKATNTLDVFSIATGAKVFSTPVGGTPADAVFNGRNVWTSNRDGTVSKVNLATHATTTIDVGGPNRRIASVGNRIFVADQTGSVAIVNARTDAIMRTIDVPGSIRGMAVGHASRHLYVAAYGLNQVVSIPIAHKRSVPPNATSAPRPPKPRLNAIGLGIDLMFVLFEAHF